MCPAGGNQYRFLLTSVKLHMPTYRLRHDYHVSKMKELHTHGLPIHLFQHEMSLLTIPAGTTQFSDLLFSRDNLPVKIYAGMLLESSLHGVRSEYPNRYQSFGMVNLDFEINSKRVPYNGYRNDFDSGDYLRLYDATFRSLNYRGLATCPRDRWPDGNLIFCQDLGPLSTNPDCDYINATHSGTLRINLSFKQPLAANVTLVVVGAFLRTLEIAKDTTVSVKDYGVRS